MQQKTIDQKNDRYIDDRNDQDTFPVTYITIKIIKNIRQMAFPLLILNREPLSSEKYIQNRSSDRSSVG